MTEKISIINYGLGNLHSIKNAIINCNYDYEIISDPKKLDSSSKIILPGVGSFKVAMNLIKEQGWEEKLNLNVIEKKKYILGICLGMQLFGTTSEENGKTKGLNFIEGEIKFLKNIGCNYKLPQINWNSISIVKKHNFLKEVEDGSEFYFINSLVLVPKKKENIVANTNYGVDFTSIVANENIFGTQFHPEKSSTAGLKLFQNFLKA